MLVEPPRTPTYQKDEDGECQLRRLNRLLRPLEEQLIARFNCPDSPVAFVVGAPRSGTTLVAELLAHCGAFGYVNNFVARFWEAPYIGALVDRALGLTDAGSKSAFGSDQGATPGWKGPHEFGYFWSRWFNFRATHKVGLDDLAIVDTVKLRRELAGIEHVYGKPLFFKNVTCGLQASFLAGILKKCVFLVCRRQPVFNMQSLLLSREAVLGDRSLWWSLRPKEYPRLLTLSPYQQVAAQVYYTLQDVEAEIASLPPDQKLHVSYEEVCSHPRLVLQRIARAVESLGGRMDAGFAGIPDRFESANVQRLEPFEFEALRRAAKQYFNSEAIE